MLLYRLIVSDQARVVVQYMHAKHNVIAATELGIRVSRLDVIVVVGWLILCPSNKMGRPADRPFNGREEQVERDLRQLKGADNSVRIT